MNNVIVTENLTKKFNTPSGDYTAVDNISIYVEKGSVFGFLGPNGAGKTTTVRLLNGLITPDNGRALIMGKDVNKNGEIIRKHSGVQTDTNLYEKLSAWDNLYLWGMFFEMEQKKLKNRIVLLLDMFDLLKKKDMPVGSFSKGMKQKLMIARALIHNPEILFLDEPTAGLDPESSEEILSYLQQYVKNEKSTIFLCSHRLEEVETLCSSIAIIYKGKILAFDTVQNLLHSLWKEHQFNIEFLNVRDGFTESLENDKRIMKIKKSGKFMMITVHDKTAVPSIITTLVQSGAEIMSVTERKHTLKDIYFKLIPSIHREK